MAPLKVVCLPLAFMFVSTSVRATDLCTDPIALMSDGVQVGLVTADLDADTEQLTVSVNLEAGYTFVGVEAHGGLASSPLSSVFPLNKNNLPQPGKFSSTSGPTAGTSVELGVPCSKDCSFDYGDEIVLGVRATIVDSTAATHETWSGGQPFSPNKKNPATYSTCVVNLTPDAGPLTVQVYAPGLAAQKIAPRLANLLAPETAPGINLSLPENTVHPGAAAGVVSVPATWICSQSEQHPSWGQIYVIRNGERLYMPAAVPAEAHESCLTFNKRIARVYTETEGDFAGRFSVEFDLPGSFNLASPSTPSHAISEPYFFDYIVDDEFGQTAVGTVTMVFDGHTGIPVEIDIVLQNLIDANRTSPLVNEVIVLDTEGAPEVQISPSETLQVIASGQVDTQDPPRTNWVIATVDTGGTIYSEFPNTSSVCTTEGCLPPPTITGIQVMAQTQDGAACDTDLSVAYAADCTDFGSGGFQQVSLNVSHDNTDGSPLYSQSLMQTMISLFDPCPTTQLMSDGSCCSLTIEGGGPDCNQNGAFICPIKGDRCD